MGSAATNSLGILPDPVYAWLFCKACLLRIEMNYFLEINISHILIEVKTTDKQILIVDLHNWKTVTINVRLIKDEGDSDISMLEIDT